MRKTFFSLFPFQIIKEKVDSYLVKEFYPVKETCLSNQLSNYFFIFDVVIGELQQVLYIWV